MKTSIYALAAAAALVATPAAFASAADAPAGAPTVAAIADAARSPIAPADSRADRVFHADYSKALSTGQMSAAWQTEMDRLFPQPVTGGG